MCLRLAAMALLRVVSFLPCPSCVNDRGQRDVLFAFLYRQKRFNWELTGEWVRNEAYSMQDQIICSL